MCALQVVVVLTVAACLRKEAFGDDEGEGEGVGMVWLQGARGGIDFGGDGLAQFEKGLVGATLAGDGGSFDGCSGGSYRCQYTRL